MYTGAVVVPRGQESQLTKGVTEKYLCGEGDSKDTLATFRLEYEDDYKYEFSVLRTCFRFGG